MHRLDRLVSGLLIFAKSADKADFLRQQVLCRALLFSLMIIRKKHNFLSLELWHKLEFELFNALLPMKHRFLEMLPLFVSWLRYWHLWDTFWHMLGSSEHTACVYVGHVNLLHKVLESVECMCATWTFELANWCYILWCSTLSSFLTYLTWHRCWCWICIKLSW